MDIFPLLFGAVVVLIIVGAIYGSIQAKKRREAIARWARSHGLSFTEAKDYGFDERFAEFDCLRQGDDRYAFNIIEGDWEGRRLLAFDYHYETHSTDSKGRRTTHNHYFSAVILRANIPLKPLIIRREGLFDKLAGVFGFDDIDFESAEFSRRFYVKAEDKKWAYDIIHARMMEHLLAHRGYSIQFGLWHIIAWRDAVFDVPEVERVADMASGIVERFPDYVVQPHSAGAKA